MTKRKRCEICEAHRLMTGGDRDAIDRAIAGGVLGAVTYGEVREFRDHLPDGLRQIWDLIEREEGIGVALGYTLQQVLRETLPNLRVFYPGRRVQ